MTGFFCLGSTIGYKMFSNDITISFDQIVNDLQNQ